MLAFIVATGLGSKRAKLTDFMPQFDKGLPQKQSQASILASLNQYANAHRASRERLKRRTGKA